MMRVVGVAVLALATAATSAASEQTPTAEMEVRDTVVHFLELLGGLRFYALGQYLSQDANVITARWSRSGFVNRVQSSRDWLDGLMEGPAPQPFREELSNVDVELASDVLAMVRADFEIVRDAGVASFGVDFFTLVREDDRWKIASIAYTSIPASEQNPKD